MHKLTMWLNSDEAPYWTGWITNPRCRLAYAVSDAGAAISRLGNRIHHEAPGDYSQGQADGQDVGQLWGVHARRTRDEVRAYLGSIGLPNDDDTLEQMGWRGAQQVA